MKTNFIFNFILLVLVAGSGAAQSAPPPRPIQDNSILLEEAYNQEEGVVQHISGFQRDWSSNDWRTTFTQEWPVRGQKNQFSYTLDSCRHTGTTAHWSDLRLNWRYQLIGSGETKLAFSPRFSLVLPTGNSDRGMGRGAVGYEFNLPVSVQHNRHLVTHWNAGATITPGAKDTLRNRALTRDVALGQSTIWLAYPRFNVMMESIYGSYESVTGPKSTLRENGMILNPGFRWAHNFESGLQIVPGISFPMGVAGSARGQRGFLLYVSFEHPWSRKARQ